MNRVEARRALDSYADVVPARESVVRYVADVALCLDVVAVYWVSGHCELRGFLRGTGSSEPAVWVTWTPGGSAEATFGRSYRGPGSTCAGDAVTKLITVFLRYVDRDDWAPASGVFAPTRC